LFVNDDVVDNHREVMLVNFDVEQFVYLHVNRPMSVYDNSIDEYLILSVLPMYVDDVHDDIHLNVDEHFSHCQYYVEIQLMNNGHHLLQRVLMLDELIDDNQHFL